MVYFISGLAADERVFKFIELPGFEVKHINWIQPLPYETLSHYAGRLIPQIDQTKEVILIGLSFGGIICQEVAARIPCKKVIIISSVKSHEELDWKIRLAEFTRLHKLLPAALLKQLALLVANFFFSIKNQEDAVLLKEIIKDTDSSFVKWALHAILKWKPSANIPNLVQIHGTIDQIFPIGKITEPTITIHGGGHFMIADKAHTISALIMESLQEKKSGSAF